MKKIKRICCMILAVAMMFGMNASVWGERYAAIQNNGYAKVVEIIDGDSIKVVLLETGETALIRLIGINSEGYDGAINYLNNYLMGKRVYLSFDTKVPKLVNYRWNNMYVKCDGVSVNLELVAKGFAKVDTSYQNAADYSTLLSYERSAENAHAGVWDVGKGISGGSYYVYSGNAVNINTASSSDLQSLLSGVSSAVASRIVSYRSRNPFNDIYELKFVDGFTKEMFDKNRNNITVSTNINRASEKELMTLSNITQSEAQRIIEYRGRSGFSNIDQLYRQGLISDYRFNDIKPFISTEDTSYIVFAIPNRTVNINTATSAQLTNAGLSSSQASAIINHRSGYSYKNLGELTHVPGLSLSNSDINAFADNLKVKTDVNRASLTEIRSLFGSDSDNDWYTYAQKVFDNKPYRSLSSFSDYIPTSVYNAIIPYMYIDSLNFDLININTATREQIRSLGLSEDSVSAIYNKRGSMRYSSDIPVSISEYKDKISLYTNINTATTRELESLSTAMTSSLANDIVRYRNDQPFGSLEELRTFLRDKDAGNVYDAIRDYVVLR